MSVTFSAKDDKRWGGRHRGLGMHKNTLPVFYCVHTIIGMETSMNIHFDPDNDAANQEKHGLSLALGVDLEWDSALTWPDRRRDYGEARQCAIGYIGLRLFFVAFVDRPEGRRIISLRKANAREVKRYAST